MKDQKVVVLSGGVGGAKVALGLHSILRSGNLTVVVNIGDDFDHLGLRICPDIDTVLYTLSGLANQELGWGRCDETWNFMSALDTLAGEIWFQLGDRDLALHVLRTQALTEGITLSEFTQTTADQWGISSCIVPASNDRVSTIVHTDEGPLPFQDYFVRRRCQPKVESLRFAGAEQATPSPQVLTVLSDQELDAVIIAPSNPYLSIAPILAIPGIRDALEKTQAPVVAVTPILEGKSVKGPTAKIMEELQLLPSALTIARHYGDLIDGFLLDSRDRQLLDEMPVPARAVDTLMKSLDDHKRVAEDALALACSLRRKQCDGKKFQ